MIAERKVVTKIEANPLLVSRERERTIIRVAAYPDWTSIDIVNTLSNLFFDNSGPFLLLRSNPVEFQQMKTIRNKISHVSKQSTKSFNTLTNMQIATTNIRAAAFLSTLKDHTTTTYYTYYTDLIKSYVEAICNK